MSNFISDLIKDFAHFSLFILIKRSYDYWLTLNELWTLSQLLHFLSNTPVKNALTHSFICKLANSKQLITNELFWVVSQHYSHNEIVLIGSKNTTVASKSRVVPRWANPYAHLLWGIAGVIQHGRKWEKKGEGASLRRWCWLEAVLLWIWLWHWKTMALLQHLVGCLTEMEP